MLSLNTAEFCAPGRCREWAVGHCHAIPSAAVPAAAACAAMERRPTTCTCATDRIMEIPVDWIRVIVASEIINDAMGRWWMGEPTFCHISEVRWWSSSSIENCELVSSVLVLKEPVWISRVKRMLKVKKQWCDFECSNLCSCRLGFHWNIIRVENLLSVIVVATSVNASHLKFRFQMLRRGWTGSCRRHADFEILRV